MKKKILGILVCVLMIATVLPVTGNIAKYGIEIEKDIEIGQQVTPATGTVQQALPDLTPTRVWYTPLNPKAGIDWVTIFARIDNIDTVDAYNVEVMFEVGPWGVLVPWNGVQTKTIPYIPATTPNRKGYAYTTLVAMPTKVGVNNYDIVVDPNNTIAESRENNNYLHTCVIAVHPSVVEVEIPVTVWWPLQGEKDWISVWVNESTVPAGWSAEVSPDHLELAEGETGAVTLWVYVPEETEVVGKIEVEAASEMSGKFSSATVVVCHVDLYPTNLRTDPCPPESGVHCTISADINNIDLVENATNVTVDFYAAPRGEPWARIGSEVIPLILPGSTVPVDVSWTPTTQWCCDKWCDIKVVVDEYDTIPECSEINNEAWISTIEKIGIALGETIDVPIPIKKRSGGGEWITLEIYDIKVRQIDDTKWETIPALPPGWFAEESWSVVWLNDSSEIKSINLTVTAPPNATVGDTAVIKVRSIDSNGFGPMIEVGFEVIINNQPNKPSKPSGTTSGKTGTSYTYSSSTTDQDGDKVKYAWDWNGDGAIDQWDDNGGSYYASGATVSTSHTWTSDGTYNVKVMAEDTNGAQSDWSDPLSVSMPKGKNEKSINTPFIQFLEDLLQNHPYLFPLLRQIMKL